MTVAELLDNISSKELSEWQAFFNLEPFGYEVNMLGHAVTASTIANVNRKKGSKMVTPQDFIPKPERQENSIDGAIGYVATLTAIYGGEDKRKHGDDS